MFNTCGFGTLTEASYGAEETRSQMHQACLGSFPDSLPDCGPRTMGPRHRTGPCLHAQRCTQRDPQKAQGTEKRNGRPEVCSEGHPLGSRVETARGGYFHRGSDGLSKEGTFDGGHWDGKGGFRNTPTSRQQHRRGPRGAEASASGEPDCGSYTGPSSSPVSVQGRLRR